MSNAAPVNPALQKLANAKMHADHIKLDYGRYTFRVEAHRGKFGGYHGDTAIAELKTLKAEDLPSYPAGPNGEQVKRGRPHRIDEVVSYTESLSKAGKQGEATTGRFQKHLTKVGSFDTVFNGNQLAFIFGDAQPFAFFQVEVEVTPKWLDPKPPYTTGTFVKNYRWTTVELTAEGLAEIQKLRAEAKLPDLAETLEQLTALGA